MKPCCFVLLALLTTTAQADDPSGKADRAAAQKQLEKIQQLVGQWKGVGQPQRGSTRDSWVEEADWAWSFDGAVALVGKQPQGKYFTEIKLLRGENDRAYELVATPATAGEELRCIGTLDDAGKLQLVAVEPRDGLPARISIRFVAGGDRLLMLLERKGTADQYVRLAEVGYTRQGSGFGEGKSGPECIVTGGTGSIEVMHNGTKYYVCCTGCLEYFNDHPDEVIAEYKARKEAEKKEREGKQM
jgi:hypothetical protein